MTIMPSNVQPCIGQNDNNVSDEVEEDDTETRTSPDRSKISRISTLLMGSSESRDARITPWDVPIYIPWTFGNSWGGGAITLPG